MIKIKIIYSRTKLTQLSEDITIHITKSSNQKTSRPSGIDEKIHNFKHEIIPFCIDKFNNKCFYCESLNPETIDHFRPPKLSRTHKNENIESGGYWWLEYEIKNLVPICTDCNMRKGSYFPINGERGIFPQSIREIEEVEKRLIIDPRIEDPSMHFDYTEEGELIPLSKSAAETIAVLGLNRENLLFKRRKTFEQFKSKFDSLIDIESSSYILNRFKTELDDKYEFSGVIRWYLGNYFQKQGWNKSLVYGYNTLLKKKNNKTFEVKSIFRAITSVNIKNFLGIRDFYFEFSKDDYQKTPILFLIGPNGSGKTSVLKAISYLFSSATEKKVFESFHQGFMKTANINIEIKFDYGSGSIRLLDKIPSNKTSTRDINILGFGAHRINLPNNETRKPKPISVRSIFDPYYHLSNSYKWITNETLFSNSQFYKFKFPLKQFLDLDSEDDIYRLGGELYIIRNGKDESYSQFSEGYKNLCSLFIDIVVNLAPSSEMFDLAEGIVMIDEIENHLHPEWRQNICRKLTDIFPRIQFIISTHDPLILNSVEHSKIVYFKRSNDEYQTELLLTPTGMTAEQILTHEYFGLDSTLDPVSQQLYNEYLIELLNDKEKAELIEKDLRQRLGRFSETSLEKMAHQLVAESVQNKFGKLSSKEKEDIFENLRNELKEHLNAQT